MREFFLIQRDKCKKKNDISKEKTYLFIIV